MRLRRRALRRGTCLPRPRRHRAPAHAPQLPPPLGRCHGRCTQDLRRLCQVVCSVSLLLNPVAVSHISMSSSSYTTQEQAICADCWSATSRTQYARAALPHGDRLCARHLRRGVGRVLPPAAPPRRRPVHPGPLPLPRVVLPHCRAPGRGSPRASLASSCPPPSCTPTAATAKTPAAHAAQHAPAAPAQPAPRADPRHTHPRRLLAPLFIVLSPPLFPSPAFLLPSCFVWCRVFF